MAYDDSMETRLDKYGPGALTTAELVALLVGLEVIESELRQRPEVVRELPRSYATLQGVKGFGPRASRRVALALELGRRYAGQQEGKKPARITSPETAAAQVDDMAWLKQEEMRVILLNTRNDVLAVKTVYRGSVNTAIVRPGELFRDALQYGNVAAIILVHNHPSGDSTPSPEDVRVTREVTNAGDLLGIDVLDHLIVSSGGYTSLKETGLM